MSAERELEHLKAQGMRDKRIIWVLIQQLGGRVDLSPAALDYFQDDWELIETDDPEMFGKRFIARKLKTINVT